MKKDLTVYPYFGKKNTVAEAIWQCFGTTGGEYFEPPQKITLSEAERCICTGRNITVSNGQR